MPLLCKQRALYVKGCVIANGVRDSQGDTLYSEDIKKIFTSFNNQDNFEIHHNDFALEEVSLLENYISTADETLGTSIVPSGSWNCVIRVDNPEIQEGLLAGELRGLSLSNKIAPRCKGDLSGIVRYKDVADAECVVPVFISFVESGANGYGLHIYDYDAYIKKSKDVELKGENGGHIMDFKEFLNGLKSLIKEAETPEEEDATIEKDETEEAVEVEETTEEVVEEEAATEEPAVEKAAEESEEEEAEAAEEEEEAAEAEATEDETVEEEEAEIVKEETDDDDDFEAKVTAIVEKILAEKAEPEEEETEEETPDPEEEPEDEDTPKITKSEKVVITEETQVKQSNYFEISGRDPLTGKKIRK